MRRKFTLQLARPHNSYHDGYQDAVDTFADAFGISRPVVDVSDVMAALADGDGLGKLVVRIRKAVRKAAGQ